METLPAKFTVTITPELFEKTLKDSIAAHHGQPCGNHGCVCVMAVAAKHELKTPTMMGVTTLSAGEVCYLIDNVGYLIRSRFDNLVQQNTYARATADVIEKSRAEALAALPAQVTFTRK